MQELYLYAKVLKEIIDRTTKKRRYFMIWVNGIQDIIQEI